MPSSTPLLWFLRFRMVRMQLGSREIQRSLYLLGFFSESKEHKVRKY